MYKIWVRDSAKGKWRSLKTKEFKEAWEGYWFLERGCTDKDGTTEFVVLEESEMRPKQEPDL